MHDEAARAFEQRDLAGPRRARTDDDALSGSQRRVHRGPVDLDLDRAAREQREERLELCPREGVAHAAQISVRSGTKRSSRAKESSKQGT